MRATRAIDVLGAIALASFTVHTTLSWLLAASMPKPPKALDHKERLFFDRIADQAPLWLQDDLKGVGTFSDSLSFYVAICAPLAVQVLCFLIGYRIVVRTPAAEHPELARRMARWAISFVIVSIPAYNVLTHDIWLSVAWGRMTLDGVDPYLIPFSEKYLVGLPLDHVPVTMTYGPIWAFISAVIVWVTGNSGLGAWLLMKVVLAIATLVSLDTLRAIARIHFPEREAVAVLIFIWLPLVIHCSVAEGHNDIVMIVFVLIYVRLIATPAAAIGPVMLALGTLVKYVSAPLAAFEAIYFWRNRQLGIRQYILRILPMALLLALGAAFVMSGGRINETASMAGWHFLEPAEIVRFFEHASGIRVPGEGPIFKAIFGGILALSIVGLWREPTFDNLLNVHLAFFAAVIFSVVGHSWPWFFVWVLPFAALTVGHRLRTFVVVSALLIPFSIVYWRRTDGLITQVELSYIPSLIVFGFAALATFCASRRDIRVLVQSATTGLANKAKL